MNFPKTKTSISFFSPSSESCSHALQQYPLCQVKPHVHSSVGNLRDDATERSCSGKAICRDEQRTALKDRGLAHGDGDLAEWFEKLYPACRVKGSWAKKPSSTRVSRLPWKHSNDVIPLCPSCNDLNF